MVLIAASMGLRFGEIANLRWKHIDFDNGFATLEKTKNGDARFVPAARSGRSLSQRNTAPEASRGIFVPIQRIRQSAIPIR